MRTALVRLSTVTLEMNDALELSELLDHLDRWLAEADSTVQADLQRFAAGRKLRCPRQQLFGFSQLLVFGEGDTGELDDDADANTRGWR